MTAGELLEAFLLALVFSALVAVVCWSWWRY